MIIIDAHEDLAWNTLAFGRDYRRSVEETRQLEEGTETPALNGQSMLGWPEWIKGRVAIVISSLFAAPARWAVDGWDQLCYEDPEDAHRLYQANLDLYHQWFDQHPGHYRLIDNQADLQAHWRTWQDPEQEAPVGLVLLMEGADGVRDPAELERWFEGGVRILGPAWSGTRYAGGTREPGPLSDLGRGLLRQMEDLEMILDLSHMSEDGALEALEIFNGAVIATHSSPLARVPNALFPERHTSDALLRRIAERGGVMGLVLGNAFLQDGWRIGMAREMVGMQDVVAAIDHVCQLLGNAEHIALGSDFDGGFGLDRVPTGLDSIADLQLIGLALQEHGYPIDDVERIMGVNWYHLLYRGLPRNRF